MPDLQLMWLMWKDIGKVIVQVGHIAFQTDEIYTLLDLALEKGAKKIGELSEKYVDGVGFLTFIYISDPDGNIMELQNWS